MPNELKSVLDDVEIYEKRQVTIAFEDKILAGCPKKGDMLAFYMEAKHMSDAEKEDFKKRIEDGDLTDEEKEEQKETNWTIFEKDAEGFLVIWHNNVKALLRECATTLGLTQIRYSGNTAKAKPKKAKKGEEAEVVPLEPEKAEVKEAHAGGRQTFQHGLQIDPLRIRILKDGQPIQRPDGFVDRVKHIQDAGGKRSAIGRHDYVERPTLTFTLMWPLNGAFKEEHIKKMLKLAEKDGVGASRSQGFGTFVVTEFNSSFSTAPTRSHL